MGMDRPYWRWSAGVQLMRLPSMMAPLAYAVLATQVTGSYRLGGLMMAVFVVAELVAARWVGRLLDRIGVAQGLRVLLVLCAASLFGLVLSGAALLFVALTGVFAGGMAGGFRALLSTQVSAESLERAISVDAIVVECVVVGGPLVVALLTPLGGKAPVIGMAVSYLLSALLVPRVAAVRTPHGQRPPLGSIAPWLLSAFAFGHLLSTIEVASLPLGQRVGGGTATAVIVVAVLTGASVTGAALYAWLGPRMTLDRRIRAVLFLLGMAGGAVLVAFGGNWPLLLAGLVTVGICTGPLNTTMSMQLQNTLPEERRAEGFGLVFTCQAAGFALGSLSVSVLPLVAAPLLGAVSALAAGMWLSGSRVATAVTVE
jgi:MFS family permease